MIKTTKTNLERMICSCAITQSDNFEIFVKNQSLWYISNSNCQPDKDGIDDLTSYLTPDSRSIKIKSVVDYSTQVAWSDILIIQYFFFH